MEIIGKSRWFMSSTNILRRNIHSVISEFDIHKLCAYFRYTYRSIKHGTPQRQLYLSSIMDFTEIWTDESHLVRDVEKKKKKSKDCAKHCFLIRIILFNIKECYFILVYVQCSFPWLSFTKNRIRCSKARRIYKMMSFQRSGFLFLPLVRSNWSYSDTTLLRNRVFSS